MPGVDLLRREGARGDAAVRSADEEPAAGDGHPCEGVDGEAVGEAVRACPQLPQQRLHFLLQEAGMAEAQPT